MMTMPGLRLTRFALTLIVLTAPATLAHEHAGSAPSIAALVVVSLALGPFAWFATARTLERRTMVAAAGGAQLLAHSVFAFLQGPGHHAPSTGMLAAHGAAAVISALALAYADQLLAFIDACLAPLRLLSAALTPAPEPRPSLVSRAVAPLIETHFLTSVHRRGPPVGA